MPPNKIGSKSILDHFIGPLYGLLWGKFPDQIIFYDERGCITLPLDARQFSLLTVFLVLIEIIECRFCLKQHEFDASKFILGRLVDSHNSFTYFRPC